MSPAQGRPFLNAALFPLRMRTPAAMPCNSFEIYSQLRVQLNKKTWEERMPIRSRRGCRLAGFAALLAAGGTGAAAAEPVAPAQPTEAIAAARAAVSGLTAKDAGARYGQALGAVEVCVGAKVTPMATALSYLYEGTDLETFKAQTAKIYDAWIKVKHCVRQDDPNQCKVIMDESCAAAVAEIGPKGTALSGLLEPPPR
jgi:hypothetical protein